ncbi:MAG: FAD-dependent oxidoreductase [Neomegalonema sp.]|nr:FAD-dependent oxidoreductase [Neomegalonema sp.]
MRRLILAGGGHAHALVLAAYAAQPLSDVELILISPDTHAPYTGMLPGVVAGHYRDEQHQINLARLVERAGGVQRLDRVAELDPEAKELRLESGEAMAYDVLSLNVGAFSGPVGLMDPRVAPVKPFGRFLPTLNEFFDAAGEGRVRPHAAVIGGGLGGMELAFAIAFRLRGAADARVTVLTRDVEPLNELPPRFRRRILARAPKAGVEIISSFDVTAVEDGAAKSADGRAFEADFFAAAAGVRAAPWVAESGMACDPAGFAHVKSTLAALGFWDHFAAGDAASLIASPRPKSGVFAVRQAPVLAHNLRQAIASGGPGAEMNYRAYHPQKDYLKLVSLGARRAIAEKRGVVMEGRWVWSLKDRIDRAFMAKLGGA